jgi:hypothetical protein
MKSNLTGKLGDMKGKLSGVSEKFGDMKSKASGLMGKLSAFGTKRGGQALSRKLHKKNKWRTRRQPTK